MDISYGYGLAHCLTSWLETTSYNMAMPYHLYNLVSFQYSISGWWFGTLKICFYILGRIIPTDYIICLYMFQRGRYTTNQIYIYVEMFYYNMLLFKLVDPQFCWMVCRGSWEAPVVPVALQGWGCRASRAFAKIIKKWCKTWHIDAHISYIDLQYIGFIGALELVVNT